MTPYFPQSSDGPNLLQPEMESVMHPKPVKGVQTFDGRLHEVDIRQVQREFTAWAFVDRRIIEGESAATQVKAIANWKAAYKVTLTPSAD